MNKINLRNKLYEGLYNSISDISINGPPFIDNNLRLHNNINMGDELPTQNLYNEIDVLDSNAADDAKRKGKCRVCPDRKRSL